ncbi:uncharacterized protein [Physcomitrium patens]|uniref:uncharacterized protein isoform X4 n=1 Tax=Physcomitrium patens TaxID=3218 RepID=UPI003CCC9EBD
MPFGICIRRVIGHYFLRFHESVATHVGVLHLRESPMTTKGITWARMIMRQRVNIQSAYEGEMVEVKHGNGLVTSFDRSIQNAS